jgi:predicted nucleic acid-binding protein
MGQPGAEDVPSLPWIIRHQVTQHPLVKVLRLELDAGEAEALACALELKADLILLDERRARDVAQRLGLRFVGLLGVLIEAQRQNRLHRIRPVLDDLRQNAGFWITDALYQRVLAAAGE